ncbi:hypothetical protein CU097_009469 [Rhizopus azygosporus]|uniref:Uncharacterized protein n=2 Tax=Rhizopus TaxID=4842 RepID=A0A367K8G4_RHIAZ|nr:hypothetical protein BCV71DRAFT_293899 [Rhizopus microsporus]RCH98419.1 hypothetical protein CU097_009469 [Rhizopus azygosporus]
MEKPRQVRIVSVPSFGVAVNTYETLGRQRGVKSIVAASRSSVEALPGCTEAGKQETIDFALGGFIESLEEQLEWAIHKLEKARPKRREQYRPYIAARIAADARKDMLKERQNRKADLWKAIAIEKGTGDSPEPLELCRSQWQDTQNMLEFGKQQRVQNCHAAVD